MDLIIKSRVLIFKQFPNAAVGEGSTIFLSLMANLIKIFSTRVITEACRADISYVQMIRLNKTHQHADCKLVIMRNWEQLRCFSGCSLLP